MGSSRLRTQCYQELSKLYEQETGKLDKLLGEAGALLLTLVPGSPEEPPRPTSKAEQLIRESYVNTLKVRVEVAKVLAGQDPTSPEASSEGVVCSGGTELWSFLSKFRVHAQRSIRHFWGSRQCFLPT